MRIYQFGVVVFSICWMVFLFMDYLQKHPIYLTNFQVFQYYGLLGLLVVLGAAFTYGGLRLKKRKAPPRWLNGLSLYAISLVLTAITVSYYINLNTMPSGGSVMYGLGMMAYMSVAVYGVVLCAYVAGDWFLRICPIPVKGGTQTLVAIGLGILVIVTDMFVLGLFGGLRWFVLLPLALLLLGIRYRATLDFLQQTLIRPIAIPQKLNILGLGSIFALLALVGWTIFQLNLPFPKGWDALSLYVALPSLISDHGGLVSGYQPYNWSLLMSLGYIFFDHTGIVLCLSYLGGLLSMFALFQIGKDLFDVNINYNLLGMVIFCLLPSIAFQSLHDQKVDLGLLFTLSVLVLIFINWIKNYKVSEGSFWDKHIILMGLFTGFAFGIKLTTLFAFFGILATIWFVIRDKWGFLALFALSIFAILLLKLDEQSGLRAYHLSATAVQWAMLALGAGLVGWQMVQHRASFWKATRLSVVYGMFFLLPVLPWIGKNYIETRSLSTHALLNGKSVSPKGGIQDFTRNYERSRRNQ